MATTRFTTTVDNQINAIRADGSKASRTVAVLLAVVRSGAVMIAANYALSAHRSATVLVVKSDLSTDDPAG